MATPRVRSANSAPMSTVAPNLPRTLRTPTGSATLSLLPAASLLPPTRDALYALFDANIAPLAKGTSMEHDERAKREEMFDPDARFLILARSMPGALLVQEGSEVDEDELLGFVSFRFDTEETMGTRDIEVVYCYELQLSPSARGAGLGRELMAELERIGGARGMTKAMLTCLAGNAPALAFYARIGYTPDEIDPTRIADEDGWEDVDENGEAQKPDYRILSKVLV